jgi:GR25 family glycosyltransferase involved in LPS biosynthesis
LFSSNELQTKANPLSGSKELKAGELGVLASMQNLFLHAQSLKLPAILVLEDDALLHKEFGKILKDLLSTSARCSNYLRGESR